LQGALNSGFHSGIADRHHHFMNDKNAKFGIGAIVRHRVYPFRGVVVDVDPEFDNTDEWYEAIPAEVRPNKEQPFYHLLAENSDSYYTAYVSQQNLLPDGENGPVSHPDVDDMFDGLDGERYVLHPEAFN
jgi:heat shock protein HspQ